MQNYISSLKRFLLLSLLSIALSAGADADQARAHGHWLTDDKDGTIEVSTTGTGILQGQIVAGRGGKDRLDSKNPDPAQRTQSLRGKLILQGMKYDGNGKWSGGTIYDPNNGKTYKAKVEIVGDNELKIRGYVGSPIFGRNEIWTRTTPPSNASSGQ